MSYTNEKGKANAWRAGGRESSPPGAVTRRSGREHLGGRGIPSLRVLQVPQGFDVADNEIVRRAGPGDLVITADTPLAAEVIAKGAQALNPRGERYSADTIRGLLNLRDFMDTMRASGNVGDGPPPLSQANRNAFAGHLDSWLALKARSRR